MCHKKRICRILHNRDFQRKEKKDDAVSEEYGSRPAAAQGDEKRTYLRLPDATECVCVYNIILLLGIVQLTVSEISSVQIVFFLLFSSNVLKALSFSFFQVCATLDNRFRSHRRSQKEKSSIVH